MWWSDSKIKQQVKDGGLVIAPFDVRNINPCGIDVTLGSEFITYKVLLDSAKKYDEYDIVRHSLNKHQYITLTRGLIYLGVTNEYVEIPDNAFAELTGKSSLGRLGLSIHATAGHIDPGFKGHITLELSVIQPLTIYPGMKIGQLRFANVDGIVDKPYHEKENSKYNNRLKEPIYSKYADDRSNIYGNDWRD